MGKPVTLLWLRQDLRLSDHPALAYAAARGDVLPVYIFDKGDPWPLGGASRWWLAQALADLGKALPSLVVREGEPFAVLSALAREAGADEVAWSRLYEPYARRRDAAVEEKLKKLGVSVRTFNASLLFEPWEIATKAGGPFKVFTPFFKACLGRDVARPLGEVEGNRRIKIKETNGTPAFRLRYATARQVAGVTVKGKWAGGLKAFWKVGEKAAQERLHLFIDEIMGGYKARRDRPDLDGTSLLSPYLHFGNLSPRQVWYAARHAMAVRKGADQGGEAFLRQLLWREFSFHLLWHFPDLPEKPLQTSFAKFPWRKDASALKAWQKGRTGYPIVDAGMRQLWQTGWMHNRVRMIVGSFLVKDLLLPWQAGQAWFWDTLVDADLANNAFGWQWIGGCGADPAPYFRVFNPVLQGKKFDPNGDYVRRYVPELKGIKGDQVHAPWLLGADTLRAAGATDYPKPIVDHGLARKRALEALKKTKKT